MNITELTNALSKLATAQEQFNANLSALVEAVKTLKEEKPKVTRKTKKVEKKPLKQAFIIYYAADQTTTCLTEDTKTNPFKDKEEQERKNGNYYGLTAFQYKNLLEKAGYEWAWIEHYGDYGTHIREASKGYKFHGAYRGMKVGDTKKW